MSSFSLRMHQNLFLLVLRCFPRSLVSRRFHNMKGMRRRGEKKRERRKKWKGREGKVRGGGNTAMVLDTLMQLQNYACYCIDVECLKLQS